MAQAIRQGDVLFIPVDGIPEDAVPAKGKHGRHIRALGEATGHHHSVAERDVEMLNMAEMVFLRVMAETEVVHQEHAPLTIAPGTWRVILPDEYAAEAIERVLD